MTTTDNQLFSVSDALARLAENREQGCLIVSKGPEMTQIYVQDGFVVRASSRTKDGPEAVAQAIALKDASYTWLRGIQPPNPAKNLHVSLLELNARTAALPHIAAKTEKPKAALTSRITGSARKEVEAPPQFRYFLVPQDRLTERIYLTKSSTVMGRDPDCDFFIDNSDVSWRHCLLDIQARGVSVLDLNSTNGTFVNGILVRNEPLTPGDRIELGPCVYALNREALESLPR